MVAHLRCASVKLRIRKRLHETIVEREVDVELVLVRRAGRDDGEVIGIQPEGGEFCRGLRGVLFVEAIDLRDLDENGLLARLREGIHARVERLEQLVVVVPCPTRNAARLPWGSPPIPIHALNSAKRF